MKNNQKDYLKSSLFCYRITVSQVTKKCDEYRIKKWRNFKCQLKLGLMDLEELEI